MLSVCLIMRNVFSSSTVKVNKKVTTSFALTTALFQKKGFQLLATGHLGAKDVLNNLNWTSCDNGWSKLQVPVELWPCDQCI